MSWEMKRIGEVCDVIPGFAFKSKDLRETGIPVVKIGNITDDYKVDINSVQCLPENLITEKHEKFILTNHDILIAMTGATAGKVGRIRCSEEQVLLLNQRVAKFKPRNINPNFFWSAISTPQYRTIFYRLGGGAAQPNMSGAQIEAVEIPYPPPNVQDRIASVLTAYDDLIENNQRRIQLLEQSAQLLYKEWFVHLRFSGYEHVTITDGVPEGWERKTIANVCETVGGGTPSTKVSEYWGGDVTWIVPTDVTKNDCLILLDSERKITEKGLRESSAKLVPPNTILMTSRASVGFFALMDIEVCTNQGFINIIPHDEKMRMYLLFNLMSRVAEIRSNAKGTTYPEISKGRFRQMDIVIPTRNLIVDFAKTVCDIMQQVRYLKHSTLKLTQARDLLLPRLMNGEISV